MSALYKSIALLLTINAYLINNNIIASDKNIISSNVNIIKDENIITNNLSFNNNNQSINNNSEKLNFNAKEYKRSENSIFKLTSNKNNNGIQINLDSVNWKPFIPRNPDNAINNSNRVNSNTDSTKSYEQNGNVINENLNKNDKDIIKENKNTINIINKLLDDTDNNQVKKEDKEVIDYNNPVLIENNKKLLNKIAENIDNNDLDEAKNKLEEFLKNIPHVEMNYIDKDTFKLWLENASLKCSNLQIANVRQIEKTLDRIHYYNHNLRQKKQEIVKANYAKVAEKQSSLLNRLLQDKTNNYEFHDHKYTSNDFANKKLTNNVEHLMLDNNHIFDDIGYQASHSSVINGIMELDYYNDLHKIASRIVTCFKKYYCNHYYKYIYEINPKYNKIKELLFKIINNYIINPSINAFLENANKKAGFISNIQPVNNTENDAILSIIDTIKHNELKLYVTLSDEKVVSNFTSFLGRTETNFRSIQCKHIQAIENNQDK